MGADRTTRHTEAGSTAGAAAASGAETGRDGPRLFVYGFLVLLLVGAIGSVELWPITGWRLYVEPRKPTHPSWELEAVDMSGTQHEVTLFDLPVAYRNTDRQLGRSASVDPDRAAVICHEWANAFRSRDSTVTALRIYRARVDARSGNNLTRTLVYECEPGPA